MSARLLLILFDSAYLLALTAWVGSILFFSFGIAPLIFRVLSAESAAKFVRALFPRYYAWGATCGAVALASLVCGVLTHPELRGPSIGVQAVVIVVGILMTFYGGNSLTPAINAARDARPEQTERFERLHRRSVRLNAMTLLLGVSLIVGFAARPAPKSSGIIELTPQERARRSLERGSGPRKGPLTKTVPSPPPPAADSASRLRIPRGSDVSRIEQCSAPSGGI